MRAPRTPTPVRRALAAGGAVLVVTCTLAAPAAAHGPVPSAAGPSAMTSGRVGPTAVAVLALVGVVLGALALRRRAGRPAAITALVLGLLGVALGTVFAVTADGGPGTGNGVVGAVVAVVLGALALVLGGLALTRSRRTASPGVSGATTP